MKTALETLGIAQPTKQEVVAPEPAKELDESAVIRDGMRDLDTVINEGVTAMKEAFAKASDWEPGKQTRSREVGATIMSAIVAAVKQKQDAAGKSLDRKKTPAKPGSGEITPVTNTTNIYADRQTVLQLMRDNGMLDAAASAPPAGPPSEGEGS